MEYIRFKDKVDFGNRLVKDFGFDEVKVFEKYVLNIGGIRLSITIKDGVLFYISDISMTLFGLHGNRSWNDIEGLQNIIARIVKSFLFTHKKIIKNGRKQF